MDFKTQRNVLNSQKLMMISGGSTDDSWEGFGSGLHKTVNTVVYAGTTVARAHTRSHQRCFTGNKW